MKKLVRKWLMGDTPFSEYARITTADDRAEKIFLEAGGVVTEVSQSHSLLCIEPIVFGIWLNEPVVQSYKLYFGNREKPEAVLHLDYFNSIEDKQGTLLLLKLQKSHIHHLSALKNFLIYYRYYTRDGMSFDKFKSHVCAYSYPRRIRIISFRQNDYYNIFPMDLLGDFSEQGRFVFGLRHTNVALKKIIESGKIVVAEAPCSKQETIFQLGKHHSTNAPALSALPFEVTTSKNYGFYIPDFVESYKEINIMQTLDLGSHMLLWGEVQSETRLQPAGDHLFMIHFLHLLHQKKKGISYQRF